MVHINADGFVEPCPFSHFAADNIRDASLESIIASEFFTQLRQEFEGKPFCKSCMLFEHEKLVAEIAARTGAVRTDGASGKR